MAAALPARADVKLAYVDIQRALNECNAGKRAKANIRVEIERAASETSAPAGRGPVAQGRTGQEGHADAARPTAESAGRLCQEDARLPATTKESSATSCSRRTTRSPARSSATSPPWSATLGERAGYTVVMEKGGLLWAHSLGRHHRPGDPLLRRDERQGRHARPIRDGPGRVRKARRLRGESAPAGGRGADQPAAPSASARPSRGNSRAVNGDSSSARPRRPAAPAAPSLPVPDGRSGAGVRGQPRADPQERDLQRALFQRPFPGRPVMPGVLMVEALAQSGALLALGMMNSDDESERKSAERPAAALHADRHRQACAFAAGWFPAISCGWKCGCSSIIARCGRCMRRRGWTASWRPKPNCRRWKSRRQLP